MSTSIVGRTGKKKLPKWNNFVYPHVSSPLGRILEVNPNTKDGFVRKVTLKARSTILGRPVDKIVFLETITLYNDE